MALLPIIETPDTRLKEISAPVETFDAALQTLIDDMFETMYEAPGIGLAAVQVGMPVRLLVIDLQHKDEESGTVTRTPRVFINPEIIWESEEFAVYNEGCLSVPEQYADVERPAVVRAKWLDRHGKAHEEQLDGLMSTCLQHEMDHLEGILFIDHLSRLKRGMVIKKLAKMRKVAA
jgi:peptide deformylase